MHMHAFSLYKPKKKKKQMVAKENQKQKVIKGEKVFRFQRRTTHERQEEVKKERMAVKF